MKKEKWEEKQLSSDKLAILHTRKQGCGKEKEI